MRSSTRQTISAKKPNPTEGCTRGGVAARKVDRHGGGGMVTAKKAVQKSSWTNDGESGEREATTRKGERGRMCAE